MAKIHDLKCHPKLFQALVDGTKTAEFRVNVDRDFEVGDILHQLEFEVDQTSIYPAPGKFTGRTIEHLVTHIVRGPAFGIPAGYCMMSIRPIAEER